jgi:hypothetical protein
MMTILPLVERKEIDQQKVEEEDSLDVEAE